MQDNSRGEHDEWLRILQEHAYVSTKTIDNMFEHYDIIKTYVMEGKNEITGNFS